MTNNEAFGKPGIPPRWTSSAKEGVGTSMVKSSRIHFTISHGTLNEVYFPGLDTAQIRDQELLVVSNGRFFEEKRDTYHNIETYRRGVPCYVVTNRNPEKSFTIEKTIFVDGESDTLIQHVEFSQKNSNDLFKIYSLISPHLENGGSMNTAWIEFYKGRKFQFASKNGTYLAVYSPNAQGKMSCGFSGYSDGWQDLKNNGDMTYEFNRATEGNVAMTAEIIPDNNNFFNIYIAFGHSAEEAAMKTIRSSLIPWEKSLKVYTEGWLSYRKRSNKAKLLKSDHKLEDTSMLVLKSHISKEPISGGIIASLSIPWGFNKTDDDLGGYHLIWGRDMVEAAQALLILGDVSGAVEALRFLQATQEEDGHWPQNMWLEGIPYWKGLQMDETAFPILLLHDLWRKGHIELSEFREMLIKSVKFIIANGPVTDQDRWEEDGGYSSFTIGVQITALNKASEMLDSLTMANLSVLAQDTGDIYAKNIDRWMYRQDTDLAKRYGVEGHYVRISTSGQDSSEYVSIKNRPWSSTMVRVEDVVSTGALSLVRFGIKDPQDPKILNTLKIIDGELMTITPNGPVWHRYSKDGYGEHEDGTPFDGTGKGRGWPLLCGERSNYEICSKNMERAEELLKTMENFTNNGKMIPEQVWDSENIPRRGLFKGSPSGSAMPLVWAHAEYVKTAWGLENGRPYDQDQRIMERYVIKKFVSRKDLWSFRNKSTYVRDAESIIFILQADAFIRFTKDGWKTMKDENANRVMDGLHIIELNLKDMKEGDRMEFTFFWKSSERWEGRNFTLDYHLTSAEGQHSA